MCLLHYRISEAVIRHLPDVVSPESDANWKYNYQYQEVPGSIKVIEKERSDSFVYTSEHWADGVRPRGMQVLADILMKALADIGSADVSVQNLLK